MRRKNHSLRFSSDYLNDAERIRQQLRKELRRPRPPVTDLAKRGCLHLGTKDDGAPLYLRPDFLIGERGSHLMIQAPTGAGKTTLTRQILRSLLRSREPLAIWADDPKCEPGGLYDALEQDCAALELEDRTILWNTADAVSFPGFNPCIRRNGLHVADQTLWILGAMMAAWEQERLTDTPLMWQWLFNAVALTVEHSATLQETLELLRPDSTDTRRNFLNRTNDALLHREWTTYEQWPIARRAEATGSAIRRLLPVCMNPTLRTIFGRSDQSLHFGDNLLRPGGILLTGFPRYRPLGEELTILLRSVVSQTILTQALNIPLGERPRLVVILDEAEHALKYDTGVIRTILDEGRSLGIHLVLIFHTFAQVAEKNPALLASVLSNCRQKILGGHIPDHDLETLCAEFFLEEWHPYMVRDEIEGIEIEPVEETRTQISLSQGEQESLARTTGVALASALSNARSAQLAVGSGRTEARSHTKSRASSSTCQHADGFQETDGTGGSGGEVIGADGVLLSTYTGNSSTHTGGFSSVDSYAESESEGESWGQSKGLIRSITSAIAESLVKTLTQSSSESLGETVGSSRQRSVTLTPFLAPRKRLKVTSRQFLGSNEFLITKRNILKTLGRGSWAIKPAQGVTRFFKAVWPLPPLLGDQELKERLHEFRQRVFVRSYYSGLSPAPRENLIGLSNTAETSHPESPMLEFLDPPPTNFLEKKKT